MCGDVFASPSVAAVLAAIRHVTGPPGCLLIVKNYTGDRLNFGIAAERAKLEGYKVEMVIVADDCALPPPLGVAGRRGLAGTVFVHKCAGAAAAAGRCLASTTEEARDAARAVGTMGVASRAHTMPGADAPARVIPAGQMEMGLGIHGEPGAGTAPVMPVNETVASLLETIVDASRGYMTCLNEGDGKVALMVNSLGATPLMELHIAAGTARDWLRAKGFNPVRTYVGSFMTALDMTGLSVTLCKVDQLRLARLDAPVGAPAWPAVARTPAVRAPLPKAEEGEDADDPVQDAKKSGIIPQEPETANGIATKAAIVAAANALLAAEAALTEADTKVGDGDCGLTHARGARALLEDVDYMPLDGPPEDLLFALAATVRRSMGGTSGALYDIFFSAAAAAAAESAAGAERRQDVTPWTWVNAMDVGIAAMAKYGGAQAGDRTVLDALLPAAEEARALASGRRLGSVGEAARAGAEATRDMAARAGRSSYVPAEVLKAVPDPGATAAAAWVKAAVTAIKPEWA